MEHMTWNSPQARGKHCLQSDVTEMNLREVAVLYLSTSFYQEDVDPRIFSLAALVAIGRSTGVVNKGNTI